MVAPLTLPEDLGSQAELSPEGQIKRDRQWPIDLSIRKMGTLINAHIPQWPEDAKEMVNIGNPYQSQAGEIAVKNEVLSSAEPLPQQSTIRPPEVTAVAADLQTPQTPESAMLADARAKIDQFVIPSQNTRSSLNDL